MTRRFSEIGGTRRNIRDGWKGSSGAVDPYKAILGSNMLLEYHSQLGIALVGGAVDTWTDQINGVVVQAPGATQRPVYGADGTHFSGKSVVQTATTATLFLQTTAMSPALFPSGTRPYIFARLRYTGPLNDIRNWYELSSATQNELLVYNLNNDTRVLSDGADRNTAQPTNLTAGIVLSQSSWADGVSMNMKQNAGAVHAVAYAGATATACTNVGIGNAAHNGSTNSANLSFALLIACAAYPGVSAETALYAQAATDFPP